MTKKRFKVILHHSYSVVDINKTGAIKNAKASIQDIIEAVLHNHGVTSKDVATDIIDSFGIMIKEEITNKELIEVPSLETQMDTLLEPNRKVEKAKTFIAEYIELCKKHNLGVIVQSDAEIVTVATLEDYDIHRKYLETNLSLNNIKL